MENPKILYKPTPILQTTLRFLIEGYWTIDIHELSTNSDFTCILRLHRSVLQTLHIGLVLAPLAAEQSSLNSLKKETL